MQILRRGSRGPQVKLLQERLLAKGFRPGLADGIFGPQTANAVHQFQAAHNLKVDGVVGDQTWTLLMSNLIPAPPALIASEQAELLGLIPEGTPTQGRAVLEVAIGTLGWREQPDGSNGGPEVDQISGGYYSAQDEARLGKPPWCALAVSYWLKRGLVAQRYSQIPFRARLGAVFQIESWAKQQGRFAAAKASLAAPAGTIFTMGRSGSGSDAAYSVRAGHCGFVVCDEGAHVRTIEGNTSNKVASRRRRKTALRGFVTWW